MTAKKGSIDIGQYTHLGDFVNETGAMRVADPCYQPDTWCLGILSRVATGNWKAYAQYDDGRPSRLLVLHETQIVNGVTSKLVLNRTLDADIGVDSGQAGFFDVTLNTWGRGGKGFYDRICAMTLGSKSGGVLNLGAVTSSGFGDGSYECTFATDDIPGPHPNVTLKGVIVAAELVFIE